MNRQVSMALGDKRLKITVNSLRKTVRFLDNFPEWRVPDGSLNVAFVTPPECADLHRRFFDDPDVTDVMTFPGDPADRHAGDIAICPEEAERGRHDSGLPFNQELTLYLVHGYLHLAGLDDSNEIDKTRMRTAEEKVMNYLREQEGLLAGRWMTNHA